FVALRALPDTPQQARWLAPEERRWLGEEIAREKQAAPRPAEGSSSLRNSRLWIASVCWFGLMAGANGLLYWLPQIIRDLSADSTEIQIGFISALPWVAVALGM